jgi:hypothetical protein
MFNIKIYRDSTLTNEASFSTGEELSSWFEYHKGLGSFGTNESTYEGVLVAETPAIYEDQQVLVAPAVYEEVELKDENGASFDPAQFETVEVTPAQYETQPVEISPLIPEVRGMITVPASYTYEITDTGAELAAQAVKDAKIAAGKAAREACLSVLDFIAGTNISKELTIEQITTMQQTYASAEAALKAGRPTMARNFIEAIVPDGYIVTEEEKAECLLLLTGY